MSLSLIVGEKPFTCEICQQSFVAKGSLNTHIKTHSNLKPFQCLECAFSFTTKGSLTRHMSRHQDIRPFMCPYCQKTFKSNLNCKKHIKLHRNEFALQLLKPTNESVDDENENASTGNTSTHTITNNEMNQSAQMNDFTLITINQDPIDSGTIDEYPIFSLG